MAKTRKQETSQGLAGGQGRYKVVVLACAKREGRKILNAGQYEHVSDIVKRLVDFDDAQEMSDMRIGPIGDFFELKEKGGLLGNINLRLFFGRLNREREIVVVKAYKKEEESQTPRHVVLNVESRLRAYCRGDLRENATIFEAGLDTGP